MLFTLLFYACGGGALLAYLSKVFHSLAKVPQTSTMGYFINGALGALTIAICIFAARRDTSVKIPKARNKEELDKALLAPVTSPVIVLPKLIDLTGEVLGLYFARDEGFISNYCVFMKLRITNRGPDEAVITKWILDIQVGEDSYKGESKAFDGLLALKKRDGFLLLSAPKFIYEPITPDLTKVHPSETYRKPIPKEGWVKFEINDYTHEPPVNATFTVWILDSLGIWHHFVRPAQSYTKEGEIVPMPNVLTENLGSSS